MSENTNDQGRKGYAPREWTIFKRHDNPMWTLAPRDGFVWRQDDPEPESIKLVEHSAYLEMRESVELQAGYIESVLRSQKVELAAAQARIAELEIRVGDHEKFIGSDDCFYWTPEATEKHKQELTAAKAENIGNLQLIGDLQEEINRLMDTPGGKRIYGALNEITRLNAEIERLLDSRAKELGQANARIKELSEEIAKMASDSHYVRNSGKRIKELEAKCEMLNREYADACKPHENRDLELSRMQEREQKLVASLENKDEVMESLNLAYTVRIDELKAEIENLLRALEKISELTIWNNQPLEQDFHDANEVALKALKAHRGEGGL